jgi:subtilisin family serine protease
MEVGVEFSGAHLVLDYSLISSIANMPEVNHFNVNNVGIIAASAEAFTYTTLKKPSLSNTISCGTGRNCMQDAPWGLSAMNSYPGYTLNGDFNSDYKYQTRRSGKGGINVYILDTGVNYLSSEFDTRLTIGPNFFPGEENVDTNGHGTMMASIIGGAYYGVAKNVNITSVKAFGQYGYGFSNGLLRALEWIWNDMGNQATKYPHKIINLSATFDKDATLDAAVQSFYSTEFDTSGAHRNIIVRAAGNLLADACSFSPYYPGAVVNVMSHDIDLAIQPITLLGNCSQFAAPGRRIFAYDNKFQQTNTWYGTSLAAAFFSGAYASLLSDVDLYNNTKPVTKIGNFYDGPTNFFNWMGPRDLTYNGKAVSQIARVVLPLSELYYKRPYEVYALPTSKMGTICKGDYYISCQS